MYIEIFINVVLVGITVIVMHLINNKEEERVRDKTYNTILKSGTMIKGKQTFKILPMEKYEEYLDNFVVIKQIQSLVFKSYQKETTLNKESDCKQPIQIPFGLAHPPKGTAILKDY